MRRGFTIIELLVTISIMTLLMGAAAVSINTARKNSRDGKRLGDTLLISHAVDQAAVVKRGIYPGNVAGGDPGKMCADELVTAANSNNMDLSTFPNRAIPDDPLPVTPRTQGCTSYINGYTYHTTGGSSLAKQNGSACYNYVLEVGLENEKGPDESLFVTGAALGQGVIQPPAAKRYQYFLLGHYFGTTCP